jgi:transposase
MARRRSGFPAGTGSAVAALMKSSTSKQEFIRLQAVYLAAGEDRPNNEIARVTGLSLEHIRSLHAQVRHAGVESLKSKPRGGRYREHLSAAEEAAVLATFLKAAESGGILVISEVKAALERAAGTTYHQNSIYTILARHGWRKIAPRRRHPQADVAKQDDFKKTGQHF